jgi:hypothetical protein
MMDADCWKIRQICEEQSLSMSPWIPRTRVKAAIVIYTRCRSGHSLEKTAVPEKIYQGVCPFGT